MLPLQNPPLAKETNKDLFHTNFALWSSFSFVAVVSLLSGVKEENRESLLARDVNSKEPLCTRWCMLLASFTSNHALIEMITSWSYGGTLNQVLRAKAKSNCMRNNMTKHWNINNQNSQAGYLCSLQTCLVSFSLENNPRRATPCKVIQGCLPFIKKIREILVRNFWSVRTVRVVYHLPKISGLLRRARLDSSYNMKLVRNWRNL